MTEQGKREEEQIREAEPPPVCSLCWDWVYPGEAIALLEGLAVHMRCYKMTEAY